MSDHVTSVTSALRIPSLLGEQSCRRRTTPKQSAQLPVCRDPLASGSPRGSWHALFHLGDLDEITAGVIKDGRPDGPHVHGRLSEANTRGDEALIFRIYVL